MVTFKMPAEKIRAEKIIEEALAEALSDVMLRSHREIWEDMIAEILAIQNPEIAADWEEEDPDFQTKGERNDQIKSQDSQEMGRR